MNLAPTESMECNGAISDHDARVLLYLCETGQRRFHYAPPGSDGVAIVTIALPDGAAIVEIKGAPRDWSTVEIVRAFTSEWPGNPLYAVIDVALREQGAREHAAT